MLRSTVEQRAPRSRVSAAAGAGLRCHAVSCLARLHRPEAPQSPQSPVQSPEGSRFSAAACCLPAPLSPSTNPAGPFAIGRLIPSRRAQVRVESDTLEQELGEAFESMDADHDGTLTIGELAAGLGVFASGSQQAKIAALFKLFDTNGDGSISLSEMHTMLGALFRAIAARDGFDVPRAK